MPRRRIPGRLGRLLLTAAALAVAATVTSRPFSAAQDAAPKPARVDVRKSLIELPTKKLIAAAATAEADAAPPAAERKELDVGKRAIQLPVKQLLAKPDASGQTVSPADPKNPTVEPGLVRWHDDFTTACTASAASGKPVLLFQMMGRLDQRFT